MWQLLTIIILSITNIALAKWDAVIFAKGKTVSHAFNGALYCCLLIPVWFIFHNWYLIAALLFNRLLFFNIALNWFRELEWDYRPLKPKSIIDKIGNLIPDANFMYVIYGVSFIALTIITLL